VLNAVAKPQSIVQVQTTVQTPILTSDTSIEVYTAAAFPATFPFSIVVDAGQSDAEQMTVTTSGAANWTLHPKRFVDATVQSLPMAAVLPNLPQTADFTRVAWPQNTQKALLGQIQPDDMMQTFEKLFFG
jgi:hypothetical protein